MISWSRSGRGCQACLSTEPAEGLSSFGWAATSGSSEGIRAEERGGRERKKRRGEAEAVFRQEWSSLQAGPWRYPHNYCAFWPKSPQLSQLRQGSRAPSVVCGLRWLHYPVLCSLLRQQLFVGENLEKGHIIYISCPRSLQLRQNELGENMRFQAFFCSIQTLSGIGLSYEHH